MTKDFIFKACFLLFEFIRYFLRPLLNWMRSFLKIYKTSPRMYIDAFYWSFSGECEKYTRTLQKIYVTQKIHTHVYMYTYICKSKTWNIYLSFLGHFCMVFMLIVVLWLFWHLRCHSLPPLKRISTRDSERWAKCGKCVYTLCWWNSKIDIITVFELQRLPSRIK